jgi:hypothetical protein
MQMKTVMLAWLARGLAMGGGRVRLFRFHKAVMKQWVNVWA